VYQKSRQRCRKPRLLCSYAICKTLPTCIITHCKIGDANPAHAINMDVIEHEAFGVGTFPLAFHFHPPPMAIPRSLLKLIPEDKGRQRLAILSHIATQPRRLPAILSRLPRDGVGSCVRRETWAQKGFNDSWWEITRVKLKNEGRDGRAWGRLWWRGKLVTNTANKTDEPIDGGVRHNWLHIVPSEMEKIKNRQKS